MIEKDWYVVNLCIKNIHEQSKYPLNINQINIENEIIKKIPEVCSNKNYINVKKLNYR